MIVVLVNTNMPVPYREKTWSLVANETELNIIYSSKSEPNRNWLSNKSEKNYCEWYAKNITLKTRYNHSFTHVGFSEIFVLLKLKPQVLILTSLGPNQLALMLISKLIKVRLVYFTDGNVKSEESLSRSRKLMRKLFGGWFDAGICISDEGSDLLRSFKMPRENIFRSYLCADKTFSNLVPLDERYFDFLYCGRIEPSKGAFFLLEVLKKLKHRGVQFRLLIVGTGPSEQEFLEGLSRHKICYKHVGFKAYSDLPRYYNQARHLLFPSEFDVWGLTVNEALMCGLTVFGSEHVGAVRELMHRTKRVTMLPIETDKWVSVLELLILKRPKFAIEREIDQEYNHLNAAKGIIKAISYVSQK